MPTVVGAGSIETVTAASTPPGRRGLPRSTIAVVHTNPTASAIAVVRTAPTPRLAGNRLDRRTFHLHGSVRTKRRAEAPVAFAVRTYWQVCAPVVTHETGVSYVLIMISQVAGI